MNDNKPRDRQENQREPHMGQTDGRQAQGGRSQGGDRNDKKLQSGSQAKERQRDKERGRNGSAAE